MPDHVLIPAKLTIARMRSSEPISDVRNTICHCQAKFSRPRCQKHIWPRVAATSVAYPHPSELSTDSHLNGAVSTYCRLSLPAHVPRYSVLH
jgi:hypothetical protein